MTINFTTIKGLSHIIDYLNMCVINLPSPSYILYVHFKCCLLHLDREEWSEESRLLVLAPYSTSRAPLSGFAVNFYTEMGFQSSDC